MQWNNPGSTPMSNSATRAEALYLYTVLYLLNVYNLSEVVFPKIR